MKKILILLFFCGSTSLINAQSNRPFCGYFQNKEYNVYLKFNFYDNNILVPGQEIFGEIPGYFGDKNDGRKWLITTAKIINNKEAKIDLTDDYGSEDLTGTIVIVNDSTITLTQGEGSSLKIARNRKWIKLPKKLEFKE